MSTAKFQLHKVWLKVKAEIKQTPLPRLVGAEELL